MARSNACVFRLSLYGGLAAACLIAPSAFAQFGGIFGDPPPRPPSEVPGRPPPRLQPPGPPRAAPVQPAQPAPEFDAPVRRPAGVQSQPLPPPPGAPMETAPQPTALPPTFPTQPVPPAAPAAPPPRGTPQPANTAPQPGDEVITEMPTQKIVNPTAVFSGLDKITGRITSFDVAINETVQFGALQVTPRVCYTRPPTETPNTDSFVEVDEVTLQGEVKRIFAGWTFASSPGLRGVEHPIYDIWLTDCKGGAPPVAEAPPPPRAATKPPPSRQGAQPARQPAARSPQQTLQQPQRAPVQSQPVPPPPFR